MKPDVLNFVAAMSSGIGVRKGTMQSATAKTLTATAERSPDEAAYAVHSTGPSGGGRHILLEELAPIGRGGGCTIVVDDPRVSREHVAVHLEKGITLTDLGSANGTFVGRRRLRPHQPTPLSLGEAFSIGDSTLVIRPTTLKRTCPHRAATWEEILARRAGSPRQGSGHVALVRVCGLRSGRAASAEAILGELLVSNHDWLIRSTGSEVWMGITTDSDAAGPRLQRAVLNRLASWNLDADVDVLLLRDEETAEGSTDPRLLFATEVPLRLNRGKVIFQAPSMVALKRTLTRVAPAPVSVLLLGETGTGKDVVASLLHEMSPRAAKRFVGINCATLPDSLLESELFGHERGAFTGAASVKPGLLEVAESGTVFLDEIGDLPLSLQAKLLRVIESGEVTRLGGLVPRRIDVRFVAATNRDLEADVSAGRFRQDLYFRINTVTLAVPPLRERRSEIEPLARLFLTNAQSRFDLPSVDFESDTIDALEAHSWPGNVRELKNVIERAALLVADDVIRPMHLQLLRSVATSTPLTATTPISESSALRQVTSISTERERIERALAASAGNQSRAAEALGMARRTLVRKIAQLGIPRPRR